MKRSDLVVGETYAWNTTNGRLALPVKVLDNKQFYERQTARFGNVATEPVPSDRTFATKGNRYPYIEVGVLVEHTSGQREGQQALVNPAHIRATWDEWLLQSAALAKRDADTRDRKRREEDAHREIRKRLAVTLVASPYAGRIKQDSHPTKTAVDNEVLIEILTEINEAHLGPLPDGLPDEFVIDDDGPLAGVVRPATPGDYDLSKFNSADRSAAGNGGWSTYITPAVDPEPVNAAIINDMDAPNA